MEAPWKPVIALILEGITQKVCKNVGPIALGVQQEQPLAPPVITAASINANRSMTFSNHKGTLYPDLSIIHFHLALDNFQSLSHETIAYHKIYYLACVELKRSIKHAYISSGLRTGDKGYKALSISLSKAAIQAARQAFVAMKRPGHKDSEIILIAAVGPFWMWCLATSGQIFDTFPSHTVEEVLDQSKKY